MSTFIGGAIVAYIVYPAISSGVPMRSPASNSLAPLALCAMGLFSLAAAPATAGAFLFSTGNPDGKIAIASRPDTSFGFEIESADDFALTQNTGVTSASFTGLVTGSSPIASIGEVRVEIYRVFPVDSDVSRTSGIPEPGSLVLLAGGLAVLWWAWKRRH